jgi:1,4-dihydroxy-2-naphthoyl-CoA hydrolase
MSHSTDPASASPERDLSATLNANLHGWNAAMGMRFLKATGDEVIAEIEVASHHRQPYGIVHGGVHAGLIETVASVGAAVFAMPRGQSVVGLENSTSFIRAARDGTIRATARPVTRGRKTQVWEVAVTDAAGRTLSTGRVRLLCLEADAALAGEKVAIKAEEIA